MALLGYGLAASRSRPKAEKESWDDIYAKTFESGTTPAPYRGTAPVSGFLELISRPGWALRSALSGDFAAAGKHVLQMAADLPFGWIDKEWSLMNLTPDEWRYPGVADITSEEEKYEFTDMLEQWGVQGLPIKSSWGRFGLDVIGGVIDPLSLVGTPAASIGKSALKNTTTKLGREILKGALKTGRTGASPLLARFGDDAKAMDDILIESLKESQSLTAREVTALQTMADDSRRVEAAIDIAHPDRGLGVVPQVSVRTAAGTKTFKSSFFWESVSGADMQTATKWMIENGHIDTPGGISIGIPWRKPWTVVHPALAADAYLRKLAFPGYVPLAGKAEVMYGTLSEWVGSTYSRTRGFKSQHKIPEGTQTLGKSIRQQIHEYDAHTRDDIYRSLADDAEIKRISGREANPNFWDDLSPDQQVVMNHMSTLSDLNKTTPETRQEIANLLKTGAASSRMRKAMAPFYIARAGMTHDKALKKVSDLKKKVTESFNGGNHHIVNNVGADDIDMEFLSPFRVIQRRPKADGIEPHTVISIEDLLNIPQTATHTPLVREGNVMHNHLMDMKGRPLSYTEWHALKGRLGQRADKDVYDRLMNEYIEQELPRQFMAKNLSIRLSGAETHFPPAIQGVLGGANKVQEIKNNITDKKEFSGYYTFLNAARNLSLDSVVDTKLNRQVSSLSFLDGGEFKLTVPEVAHRRLLNDNRSRAFKEASMYTDEVARGSSPDVSKESLDDYFREMFGEVVFKRGIIRKIIAGGAISLGRVGLTKKVDPFDVISVAPKEANWLGNFGYRVGPEGGVEKLFHWPGVNKFYKPLLTSHPTNPAYHIGNSVGSIFMLASDEHIGWSGVGLVLTTLGGTLGLTKKAEHMKLYAKALHTDPHTSVIGMYELSRLDPTELVGKTGMTHVEFITAARGFLGGGMSMDAADLMAQAGNTMGLFSKYVKHPLTSGFNPLSESWRKTGENMSNYMESHLRLHGFKRLIEKGVHPKVAGPRVQELLVDYTVQSGFDQGLRDIFPFIRFRLGSIAWTKAVLTKPRKLMLPAVTQRAADEWGTPRDITKPPTAWDRLDIATPKFALPTRAGAEVSLGTLGAFGRHPSARRGLLGELHPLLKLGLEQTLDREIWSNKRFASDTRAKGVEKLFAKEGLSRWGAKRDEIDGVLKKLLASTPVSRQLGAVRKLMEGFEEGPVGGSSGVPSGPWLSGRRGTTPSRT